MAGLNLWHCKQGFKPTQLICPKMPTDCSGLSQNYIEDLRGCIHKWRHANLTQNQSPPPSAHIYGYFTYTFIPSVTRVPPIWMTSLMNDPLEPNYLVYDVSGLLPKKILEIWSGTSAMENRDSGTKTWVLAADDVIVSFESG